MLTLVALKAVLSEEISWREVTLIADGLGLRIPKGYLYFAMGFSVLVEALNLTVSKRRKRAQKTT